MAHRADTEKDQRTINEEPDKGLGLETPSASKAPSMSEWNAQHVRRVGKGRAIETVSVTYEIKYTGCNRTLKITQQ